MNRAATLHDAAMSIPSRMVVPLFVVVLTLVLGLGLSMVAAGIEATTYQPQNVALALTAGHARIVPGGQSEGRITYEWGGKFGVCSTDDQGRPVSCKAFYQGY